MMLAVSHVTEYRYAEEIPVSRCHLHLLPVTRPGQAVLGARVDVEPSPVEQAEHLDYFGNLATHVAVGSVHRTLRIRATSLVDVTRAPAAAALDSPGWETVRDQVLVAATLGREAPVHFVFASRLVAPTIGIGDWVRSSFPAGRPLLDCAIALMHRVHAEFEFDATATDVATPLAQVFKTRRGVCQDFAHVTIAALRGLGIPAAYVSGYIRTLPPEGQPRLQGADATHAWVSVWCGETLGWVGLDPTNDMPVGNDHVELAVGRDYADVAPVDGVVVAASGHELDVRVDVVPASEDAI